MNLQSFKSFPHSTSSSFLIGCKWPRCENGQHWSQFSNKRWKAGNQRLLSGSLGKQRTILANQRVSLSKHKKIISLCALSCWRNVMQKNLCFSYSSTIWGGGLKEQNVCTQKICDRNFCVHNCFHEKCYPRRSQKNWEAELKLSLKAHKDYCARRFLFIWKLYEKFLFSASDIYEEVSTTAATKQWGIETLYFRQTFKWAPRVCVWVEVQLKLSLAKTDLPNTRTNLSKSLVEGTHKASWRNSCLVQLTGSCM